MYLPTPPLQRFVPGPMSALFEAEKRGSMEHTEVGGGAKEWDDYNDANRDKAHSFLKAGGRVVNNGKNIGLPMIEVVD